MPRTLLCIITMAVITAMVFTFFWWVTLWARLSHGEWWGLGATLSPIVLVPLAIAIWRDLTEPR